MTRLAAGLTSVVALLLVFSAPARAAVTLISALPSLGRATDIRQTSAIASEAEQLILYQSLSYRFADQKFDARGKVVGLGLDQTITIVTAPTAAVYGVGERLSLGFTISPLVQIRRSVALTSYSTGASLFGQTLPVGQSRRLKQQGNGTGDLTLNSQYRLSSPSSPLPRFLSLDVTVPTAPSDPRGPLDLPVGQGFYSIVPSASVGLVDGAWQHFAKVGYEFTTEADATDAAGVRSTFKAGQGANFAFGSAYQLHGGVTARAHVFGLTRDDPAQNGVTQPDQKFRNVELRPGLAAHGKRVMWSLDTFIPLSGANILRTTGLFATAEVRF